MTELATNALYYLDNVAILHRYLPDASVDLIHLEPPDQLEPRLGPPRAADRS